MTAADSQRVPPEYTPELTLVECLDRLAERFPQHVIRQHPSNVYYRFVFPTWERSEVYPSFAPDGILYGLTLLAEQLGFTAEVCLTRPGIPERARNGKCNAVVYDPRFHSGYGPTPEHALALALEQATRPRAPQEDHDAE